jgi:hypothetical protein
VLLDRQLQLSMQQVIVLTDVLCGCKTWSVTLREECGLRVLESEVLREVSGA